MRLMTALNTIGRRFVGGYRTRKWAPSPSRYMPHQGQREMARRRRRMGLG